MRTKTFIHALLSAALLVAAGTAAPLPEQQQLTPEEIAKAEGAAREQLAKLKGDAGTVQHIQDEPLGRALPRWAFFSVLFRQYPVARPAPPGLKPSNVFAVSPGGKALVLTDAGELEKLFKAHLPAAKADGQLKDAAPCSEAPRMRRWLPSQFSRSTPSALRHFHTSSSLTPHQWHRAAADSCLMARAGSSSTRSDGRPLVPTGRARGQEMRASVQPVMTTSVSLNRQVARSPLRTRGAR